MSRANKLQRWNIDRFGGNKTDDGFWTPFKHAEREIKELEEEVVMLKKARDFQTPNHTDAKELLADLKGSFYGTTSPMLIKESEVDLIIDHILKLEQELNNAKARHSDMVVYTMDKLKAMDKKIENLLIGNPTLIIES